METHKGSEHADTVRSFKVNSCEYTYKVIFENFSNYVSLSDSSSSSESGFFYPEPNVWWKVKIQKEGSELSTYLYRNKMANSVDLQWKLSVLDEKNKILYEKSEQERFAKNEGYKYSGIGESDLKEINKSKISDTVILVIYLKISKLETRTMFECASDAQFSRDVQQSFSEELVKMYDDQVGTDITLKVQDETVLAHKTILSARSPVFAKMFQQEMAESQSRVVDILDIKMSTLKELLAFVYSGERKDYDFETALEVYYAADKYEVLKLKEVCSLILTSKLDSENVIKFLQLADRHSDKILKDKALQFLRSHFTNCVESENWIQFQNEKSELYKEVLKYIKN